MSYRILWLPLLAAGILSACATAPADRGAGEVQALLVERGAVAPGLGAGTGDVTSQLVEPLTPERAVAIALLRNPELRREYARLGLAQADVVEAGRLSNPELSLSALDSNAAGESMRLGYGLVQNFTDLLLLRSRSNLAARQLVQEKSRIAERIRTLALATKAAAVEAISAAQVADMRGIVADAANASRGLAQRFYDAGNINELALTREQAAATEAALAHDSAEANRDAARWRLHRLMGLHADEYWTLVNSLPQPQAQETPLATLQALALEKRLDLTAQRNESETTQAATDLVHRWRWLPFLALGMEGERESDGAHLIGPTLSLELPIFNQGQDRVLRARALAELAAAGVSQMELDIAMEVATAHGRMAAASRRAERHVQELIPQRETILARTQELQNYMLTSQFELILARQQEFDAYQSYLEAVRDYWLARCELEHAVGAPLPGESEVPPATIAPPKLPEAPAAGSHSSHSNQHH